MSQDKLDTSADLFQDVTRGGKPLHQVLRALTGQDVQPKTFGSRVCPRCLASLNEIEQLYRDYRRAADSLLDLFTVGQKVLDADAVAAEDTEEAADLTAYFDLSACVIKVADTAAATFNALAVEQDFQVAVPRAYRASVVPAKEIPSEAGDGETGNAPLPPRALPARALCQFASLRA